MRIISFSDYMAQKVIVIGLDCATPQLMFDQYASDLPNIQQLMSAGTWGPLKSTVPPITVPAWAAMTTSRHAGDLGCYGFRSRKAGSDYNSMDIAHGGMITAPRVWDVLGEAGLHTGMLGVPQTYPARPINNGMMVTCFLTPNTSVDFTYPTTLKQEIVDLCAPDDYIFDFANRSQEPPEKVLATIYKMTDQRQRIFKDWIVNKQWDFLMMVEMGVDRIHHYLWHFMDSTHKDYVPGNPYEQKIRDYYKHIDTFIGEVRELAPPDTIIYVVSDHGAKRMDGMFVLNQWLAQEGYLVFKTPPAPGTTIEQADIDWTKTRAWAWGGFYGRLFLNVAGREPQGIVEPGQVDELIEEIRSKLSAVPGPTGQDLQHQIYRATELYPDAVGDVPDLLIFWGDLYFKIAGTVGYPSLYIDQDDKGLDYGVHDWNGIFIKHNPLIPGAGEQTQLDILDVTPTILNDFGIQPLPGMRGKVIASN